MRCGGERSEMQGRDQRWRGAIRGGGSNQRWREAIRGGGELSELKERSEVEGRGGEPPAPVTPRRPRGVTGAAASLIDGKRASPSDSGRSC